MIPVRVEQLFLSNMGFVVLLKGHNDPRSLPIFIGAAEAHAIALWINKVSMPRPLTHDLLKNILDCIECRVHRVEISDLKDGTFYAVLVIESDGVETPIDARPSDAIAIALRSSVPLFVAEKVMEEAGKVFENQEIQDAGGTGAGAASDRNESRGKPTALDMLKKELARAVAEERYERAADLRDKIKQIEHSAKAN
jgi:bifunctional DNase/RNase